MGTWSTGPFGNDFAQDWAEDLHESNDLYFIESTLDNVLANAAYLEAPFGAEGIAAVETLLRLEGRGGLADDDSAGVDEWVELVLPKYKKSRADLLDKAGKVLALVLGDASELRELWQDSEHADAWRADVAAQQARLSA